MNRVSHSFVLNTHTFTYENVIDSFVLVYRPIV